MSSVDEPNFKAFSKILCFIKELKECFGDKFPSVAKYYTLCKKTNISNHAAIYKHVNIFEDYCSRNIEAIKGEQLESLISDDIITYNEKINFDLKEIMLRAADKNTQGVIFKHLKIILHLIHPDQELKNALAVHATPTSSSSSFSSSIIGVPVVGETKEEALFSSLMSKMENKYGNSELGNVNDALADLKSNGFMEEITSSVSKGLDNGELDINNLIKGAFGMFNKIKSQSDDPQVSGMISMVESMLGNLNLSQ